MEALLKAHAAHLERVDASGSVPAKVVCKLTGHEMRADDVEAVKKHLAGSKFKRQAAAREGLSGLPENLRPHFVPEDEPGRPSGMVRCLLTDRTVKGDTASLLHHVQGKRFQEYLLKTELEALRRAKGLPVVSDQAQRPTRRKAKKKKGEDGGEEEIEVEDEEDEPLLASSESDGEDEGDEEMADAEGAPGLDREFLEMDESLPRTTHEGVVLPQKKTAKKPASGAAEAAGGGRSRGRPQKRAKRT